VFPQELDKPQNERAGTDSLSSLERVKQQLQTTMSRFEEITLKEGAGPEQVKTWGVLASAWKQVALFLSAEELYAGKPAPSILQDEDFRTALEKSRRYYYECYRMGATDAWPLVQYLALTLGLGLDKDPKTSKVSDKFKQLWAAAHARAEDSLHWGDLQQKAWAHASLIELQVLSLALEEPARTAQRCLAEALQHLQLALEIRDMRQYEQADFDVHSLRRQLSRYDIWGWGTEDMRWLSDELEKKLEERGVSLLGEDS
jgi:hypothetical protein